MAKIPEIWDAITLAKVQLYLLILKKDTDKTSHNEIEIAYLLARDPDIQKILEGKNE